jgi:hypothetical protein
MEECCAVLAMEDCGGGSALVNYERGKSAMLLTLSSAAPIEWSTRFMRWWQSCGRDLVGCNVVTCECGRGELTVALLIGESCERRREAREWGKPTEARDVASKDMQKRRRGVLHTHEQPCGTLLLTTVGHD